jgi:ATP-binding cassette, subfamily F, member 3
MALVSVSNLEKSFGARAVLRGASLAVERGDRLGLIGRNGSGKTTLLNIVTGREEADCGEVHMARELKVAWLDQTPKLSPERTVWEEARTALADLEELEQRLAAWHQRIAEAPEHVLNGADREAFARDEAAFHALAGEDRERLLGLALEKLGFRKELLTRACGQLSGG